MIDRWDLETLLDANEFIEADEDAAAVVRAAKVEATKRGRTGHARPGLDARAAMEIPTAAASTEEIQEASQALEGAVGDPELLASLKQALGLPEDADSLIE